MSLHGNLTDVPLTDIIQILTITRKTGTLFLEDDGLFGKIVLKDGNIIAVVAPSGGMNIGDLFVERGICSAEDVRAAVEVQQKLVDHKPLGQLIVEHKKISKEHLREIVIAQLETAFQELLSWEKGSFYFEIGTVKTYDDIAFIPDEMIPEVSVDTHRLLLDSLRIFDERNNSQRADLDATEAVELAFAEAGAPDPAQTDESGKPLFDGVRDDSFEWFEERLVETPWQVVFVTENQVMKRYLVDHWRNEPYSVTVVEKPGVAYEKLSQLVSGGYQPVMIADMGHLDDLLQTLNQFPHLEAVLLANSETPAEVQWSAYEHGVRAILQCPEMDEEDEGPIDPFMHALNGVVKTLFDRQQLVGAQQRVNQEQMPINQIKQGMRELQASRETSSVSLLLLNYISREIERAILFFVRNEDLIALGAYGSAEDGELIASKIANLRLPLVKDPSILESILDSGLAYNGKPDDTLAKRLEHIYEVIGRPTMADIALVPIAIEGRSVVLVYGDNGQSLQALADLGVIEILANQASVVLENELLRRKLAQPRSSENK